MNKRRTTASFFTILLAVLAAGAISYNAASSAQAVARKWVKRYDPGGHRDDPSDYAYAMAVDGSGNVYVTGQSTGVGTGQDFATIKYSGAGNELWAKRYNGPKNGNDHAWAIVVDGSGNIYVTGPSEGSSTDYDYVTIKYSGSGKQLWLKRYNGPANGVDVARAIAADRTGNIYVTGESAGSKTGKDFATIKYSSAGKELWVKRYNGPGNKDDYANAMAIDGSGNVYVAGSSASSSSGQDATVIKYSSAGKQLWVKRYNGPGNKDDSANAIVLDGSGNICVTGSSAGSSSGYDYATIKYSGAGTQLWVKRSNGPKNEDDYPRAVAVDGSGNFYVTGYTWGGWNWDSGSGNDYTTIKYSGAGKELWLKRYNGPGNREDYAQAIALDASGNIYVTGSSAGSDLEADFCDYATIKYSGAGVQLWLDRYDGPGEWGDSDDVANAIAVDKSGNVYVTGYSKSSDTGFDYATIKY